MLTWFSRHGPDARNGGTSYPGYFKWLENGSPTQGTKISIEVMYLGLFGDGNPV